jgi:hypothetical protein
MARLIDIRQDWLPRGSSNAMALTMKTPLVQWSRPQPFVLSFLLPCKKDGVYDILMYTMLSSMMFLMKRFICDNFLSLKIRRLHTIYAN